MIATDWKDIMEKVDNISPVRYGRTRNFIDGDVTRLSPYISRGVISTKFVLERVLDKGINPREIEKFLQELAWRDYWQQIWIDKGDAINDELRWPQQQVDNREMATAIINASTRIEAIDDGINELYKTGYMHNHVRMYVASIACNIGQSHWKVPAQWMYYHLFDADWASNALSWQWVAGSNSKKKYYANQGNINKFCHTWQKNTFLDVDYEMFGSMPIPGVLATTTIPELKTELPQTDDLNIDPTIPTLIYNFYNLDPNWKKDVNANRILLLEPSHFERYPISANSVKFMLELGENIPSLQVFTGEFDELQKSVQNGDIYFKEHPLNRHYKGIEVSRDWMSSVKGHFPSFFGFWKRAKKDIF